MKPYRMHIFVCHGKNCSAMGSERLFEILREKLEAAGLKTEIKTSKSGCLSVCKETEPKGGLCPAMVVYPQGIWYKNLTEKDIDDIITGHVKHGKPVDRLVHYRM